MAYIDANDLFKCETCRRYKGDKCLSWCENGECYSPSMSKIPTADVVPKSEVDLYRKQVDELEDELAQTYDKLENAKAEVAREIFEEIEKCLKHDYISSIGVYNGALELRIAELKKKYTE